MFLLLFKTFPALRNNGDKITFFQIYETYSDQENIIDLVELKTDYRHLVNIEQIAHIRLNV
ncbi:TPA: hypothetical protein U1361_001069 [Streptococcus suis]|nr:hypothetical protein [Streptococcus suis]